MKISFQVFCLIFLFSCTKENTGRPGQLLVSITVNGKTDERFVYNAKSKLERFELFGFCTTNPMDEEVYHYEGTVLKKIATTTRSLYSSTQSSCNPAAGINSEMNFEYDTQGRITKVNGQNSYWQFFYNARGLVEKQVINGNTQNSYFYEYDGNKNLVKETAPGGSITTYQYDNKVNPFYSIKLRPQMISAYYSSPNNVIASEGAARYTRSFQYDSFGFPSTMVESLNGLTYTFNYK